MAKLIAFLLLVPAFLSFFVLAESEATCYMPDGSVATNVTPCNSTATVSACCDPRDACSTSGLCLGASGWVYRSSCTDSKWGDGCPDVCRINAVTGSAYSSYTPIWPCAAGQGTTQWCCDVGSNAAACCAANFTLQNTGIAFKAGTDAEQASISSISSELASATSGLHPATSTPTSSSATESQTGSANCTTGPSTGLAVGVGVGVPLGVLAIGILSFLIWREKRRSKALELQAAGYSGGMNASPMQQPYPIGGPVHQDAYGNGIATGVQMQQGQDWSQRSPASTYGTQVEHKVNNNIPGGIPVHEVDTNIPQRHEIE